MPTKPYCCCHCCHCCYPQAAESSSWQLVGGSSGGWCAASAWQQQSTGEAAGDRPGGGAGGWGSGGETERRGREGSLDEGERVLVCAGWRSGCMSPTLLVAYRVVMRWPTRGGGGYRGQRNRGGGGTECKHMYRCRACRQAGRLVGNQTGFQGHSSWAGVRGCGQ